MNEAIDRVMRAYVLMETLSPEAEAQARDRLIKHLASLEGDEDVLAVAGLRFLRGERKTARRRRASFAPGCTST
jgi:hypothetical protein